MRKESLQIFIGKFCMNRGVKPETLKSGSSTCSSGSKCDAYHQFCDIAFQVLKHYTRSLLQAAS